MYISNENCVVVHVSYAGKCIFSFIIIYRKINIPHVKIQFALFNTTHFICKFPAMTAGAPFVSSPEPKVHHQMGMVRRPSSVVMRQQSSSLKPLNRFTSNLVCSFLVTVTPSFAHIISIDPF
jgi:hypothetical protein